MSTIKPYFIECGCHHPGHAVVYELHKGDGELPELYARVQLTNFGFWRRLKNAVKYLLKVDSCGWEESLIDADNMSKIRDLLNEYELALNEYFNREQKG